MNTPGYYWCNQCDEPAFGSRCQKCHRDAEFKTTEPARRPPEKRPAPVGVTQEQGHRLFAEIRQKLSLL